MGRNRGFLALEVGLTTGAGIILIPERKFELHDVCNKNKILRRTWKSHDHYSRSRGNWRHFKSGRAYPTVYHYEVCRTKLVHIQRGGSPTARIMEMNEYRVPHLKMVAKQAWFRLKEFIKTAFPLMIIGSFLIKLFRCSQTSRSNSIYPQPHHRHVARITNNSRGNAHLRSVEKGIDTDNASNPTRNHKFWDCFNINSDDRIYSCNPFLDTMYFN